MALFTNITIHNTKMQIRVSSWQLLEYDASFCTIYVSFHTKEKLGPGTDNNLPLLRQKVGDGPSSEGYVCTTHFGFRTHDSTSSAISEIITQPAVRIKKLVGFFFGTVDVSGSKPKKTRDRNHLNKHDTLSLHDKNVRSGLLSSFVPNFSVALTAFKFGLRKYYFVHYYR